MAESEDDRRRAERIPINDEFARFGGGGPGSTWVSDLSPSGVFVHTDELLSVGAHVELRFTVVLEDPVVIEAIGKVVRHSHKPRGMGVAFALLSPEMTERIAEVIAHRQPLDSGAPLRLPEPSRVRVEVPSDDDDHDDDDRDDRDTGASVNDSLALGRPAPIEGRPAPIEGLNVRRVSEEAVTAAFPELAKTQVFKAVDGEISEDEDDDELDTIDVELEDEDEDDEPAPAPSFRRPPPPPPPPRATPRAHATRDDERTRVYQAVPVAAGGYDEDDAPD